MGFAQAAALDERYILEVINPNGQAGGNVVADGFEPLPLLIGEPATIALLFRQPASKALVYLVAEGLQLALLVKGEANQ